jgi:hypothetical protein
MKVCLVSTNDGQDGEPWPPPDRNVLWAMVRRTNGCTLWRSIACSKSDAATVSEHFSRQQPQLRGAEHDKG